MTFDSNGGTLTGGTTNAEKKLAGKSDGEIAYSVNQTAATGLLGEKENFTFVQWNTKEDGTGTPIEKYGKITRPVTFYAIYYQSEYYYTGSEQVFTAPVDGWYRVDLWGAQGGADKCDGGKGAYVSGEVYVSAGTNLYVYVGAPGQDNTTGSGAGYNGGGNSGASEGGVSGSGGGATDVRTVSGKWNTKEGLESRIAVAAGGGGGGLHSAGGYGGALIGGSGGSGLRGATQTSAGQRGGFGYGGSSEIDGGGGGGGWYGGGASKGGSLAGEGNDEGGGGGSSYLSGFDGCVKSQTGYIFRDGQMIAGNQEMPMPDGGTEIGHTGECRARIKLIETK